ncbi:MAG TPA: hypothetical protein PLM14_09665 [Candidatus Hydrogenedentes bacterium]|nr:hypothetical protein [Candidatus Hydrogenedentota bacterium]HQE83256.1 hypothetical protein [Candidatus Hydrogenedentota bacterium]HQH53182.1 hypothetical protein [Candidatus Hydrogenedentota bacterium]HQM47173.1 hypothetical protein [Candidatus Hydrogenedentota bacterium]
MSERSNKKQPGKKAPKDKARKGVPDKTPFKGVSFDQRFIEGLIAKIAEHSGEESTRSAVQRVAAPETAPRCELR